MADSKADKPKAESVKPAALGEFSADTAKADADTTVAREQGDPRSAAGNAEAHGDPTKDATFNGVIDPSVSGGFSSTATVAQLESGKLSEEALAERKAIDALPEVAVYNPNAGLSPRVGGPYLDVLELEEAEKRRAVIEKREPDFTDMAGTAGVPLMTAGQVANLHGGSPALAEFIDAHKDDEKLGPTPVTTVPLVGTSLNVIETAEAERKARLEWDNTKVTSHDNPDVVFTDK